MPDASASTQLRKRAQKVVEAGRAAFWAHTEADMKADPTMAALRRAIEALQKELERG